MYFASWRKCDFQVHTPRDPNWRGPRPIGVGDDLDGELATVGDVDLARASWAKSFIDHCVRRGLEAIAITDHHEMTMLPYVQAEIAERRERDPVFDLWLFPGMELTCHGGVQCLIIFDADLSESWLKEVQSQLGIVVASFDEKAAKAAAITQLECHYPDVGPKLDKVPELKGRYIVLPNVSEGGGHTVLKQGAYADFKRMPYVGGYLDNCKSIESLGGKNLRRLSGEYEKWGSRYIYPLPTSDARSDDYGQLGNNRCWIKLAAPTAEAIRQAFLAHKSRISVEPPNLTNLWIKSVRTVGSSILTESDLDLSPELNTFIGGRGTGKSTLLEYLAFGLGRSCYDSGKSDYSGTDRLGSMVKDTIIAPGGNLELVVVQDGAEFRIQRTGATSYNPTIIYPDGNSQELSLKELTSLFPAVVYSQGELSEIGKQAGKQTQLSDLLQFVKPEFKREDEQLSIEIESGKLSVRKAVQALSAAWAQEAELRKLQASRAALEQRIASLLGTLPQLPEADQAHVAKYDALADLDGKRQLAERQAALVMDELAELWRTSRQPVDLSSQLTEADQIQKAYAAFNSAFADGIGALGKELSDHRDKVVAAGSEIGRLVSLAKVERDKVLEKLTEHRSVTAQVTKLQEELQELLKQIGDISSGLTSSQTKFDELTIAIGALKSVVEERAIKTREWADKIELLSDGRIETQLNEDRDISEIVDAIDTLAAKTRSQQGIRHQQVNERVKLVGAWPFLDALRADCLAALRWKQVSTSEGSEKPACEALAHAIGATDRILDTSLELIDLQRVEAVATAVPKPDISLYYCDQDQKIAFEKASEGQRAAALLFMLLEQPGGPLLVDQPEGDLDNKIVSDLAEKLHTAKQNRQIIFVSHNANIVVNGSPELVIGMDVTTDAKRAITCSGAIDQEKVRLKITETIEGGKRAFQDRRDKYGY